MMRNGELFEPLITAYHTTGNVSGLLPTPRAMDAQQLQNCLRSYETWEKGNNLTALMIGWAFGLQGREPKPSGHYVGNHLYMLGLMGYPTEWLSSVN